MANSKGLSIWRWRAGSRLCTGLLLLPIATIFLQAVFAGGDGFIPLWQSLLPTCILNSLGLTVGTVSLSLAFGLPAAWLMTMYRFPGQRLLQWALCLPLAMPPYLVAYIYTDLLDYAGPVQSRLRQIFSLYSAADYWFPSIRSLGGACMVLALALYPYVYLLARKALAAQSAALLHSARLLNHSANRALWRIVFPLAMPAIAIGASLVALEALGDFGTVSYLAQSTLTTAVYDSWLGHGDLGAAARISALILLFIFFIAMAAFYSRRRQQIYQQNTGPTWDGVPVLSGIYKILAQGYCWALILLAMGIPCMMLIDWSLRYFTRAWDGAFWHYALNSILVSSLAVGMTLLVSLALLFYSRLSNQRSATTMLRLVSQGYALPGAVLAIGLLIALSAFDYGVNSLARVLSLPVAGLLFCASIIALVLAYSVRFCVIMIDSIDSRMAKISPSLDMACRMLGNSPSQLLRRVHWPLLRQGVLAGMPIVFIESMKELNASLLLKPFNFETLTTYVFTSISHDQLEQAALPAMVLVLVGLLPVIWLHAVLENKK
ncbi:iron ABC transporter permease [Brenneria sp. 4F2]|nr:iron ABC transporter permease [Brenneria bubanii]